MTTLREAAQQALERLRKYHHGNGFVEDADCIAALEFVLAQQAEPKPMSPEQRQRWEELAAMPQQAEPAQDIHGACPTHCCPVHGCKYMHDDCPVVSGAVQPVYPRNNGCESCADEAEPLNLRDPAVQKRLATQWGYVPAAQAEPVEPVAWMVYTEGGTSAYVTDNPTDLVGAYRALPLYTAPPKDKPKPMHPELRKMWEDYFDKCFRAMPVPKQAEPVEPVAWNWMLDGQPYGQAYYGNPPDTDIAERAAIAGRTVRLLYTAPPQRKPLTEEEIEACRQQGYAHAGLSAPFDFGKAARAVERAHGIKEN